MKLLIGGFTDDCNASLSLLFFKRRKILMMMMMMMMNDDVTLSP